MILIGLCGYAGSGKDTVFETALSVSGNGWVCSRVAFADELKREVAAAFGVSIAFINANKPLFRGILQAWGIIRREIDHPEYWVRKVDAEISRRDELYRMSQEHFVFVTDVRFPNEVDMVRSRGGRLVRVVRPGVGPVNDHASETAIDSIKADYTIVNAGTKYRLSIDVQSLMDELYLKSGSRDDDPDSRPAMEPGVGQAGSGAGVGPL